MTKHKALVSWATKNTSKLHKHTTHLAWVIHCSSFYTQDDRNTQAMKAQVQVLEVFLIRSQSVRPFKHLQEMCAFESELGK
jgi:hypothetical protein